MSVVLAVFLAVIVTTAVSLISIPIFMLLVGVTVGWLSSIFKGKYWVATFMQLINYAAADFCGVLLGSLILRRGDAVRFLPVLFIPVAIGAITYARKKYRFATDQAETLNRRQKAMNLIGAVIACVLVIVVTQNW